MKETFGRLLAVGNVAEIFEWGSRVVKLYKSTGAKASAFCEASLHAGVEAMGLPVSRIWGVQEFGERWGFVFDLVEQLRTTIEEWPNVRFKETREQS